MLTADDIVTIELTDSVLNTSTKTFVATQILVTLVLAVSLKSMWNLMNVIQVVAYTRFFSAWPAFTSEIFTQMDNAITLKPVSDPIFEFGQTQF